MSFSNILWQHNLLDLTPNTLSALSIGDQIPASGAREIDFIIAAKTAEESGTTAEEIATLPFILHRCPRLSSGTLFPERNPRVVDISLDLH